MRLRARDAEGREGRSGVTTRLAVLKARNGAFPSSGEPGGCLGPDQSGVFTNSGDHPQADLKIFVGSLTLTALQIRMTAQGSSNSGQPCPRHPPKKTRVDLADVFTAIEGVNDVSG